MIYPKGNTYTGQWLAGVRAVGVAKAVYSNGDEYKGELEGEAGGEAGTRTGRPGTSDGSGSDRLVREGEGLLVYSGVELGPDGDRPHGQLAAEASGCSVSCKSCSAAGDRCKGMWSQDLPVVAERHYKESGDLYTGGWEAGLPSGEGVLTFGNNDAFEGSWSGGARVAGWARMTYHNGDVYEGGWSAEAKQHGEGRIVYGHSANSRGDDFEGVWENGYPRRGTAHVNLAAGRYDGDWADGRPHGTGHMVFSDGGTYDGEWVKGRRHGYGRLQNGVWRWYEGGWKDDLYDGAGNTTDLRSTVNYVGEFKIGKRHGQGVETFGFGLDPAMMSTSTFEGRFANDLRAEGTFTHADTTKWDRVYDEEGDVVQNRLKGERLTFKAATMMTMRGGRVFLSGASDRPSQLDICGKNTTAMVADDRGKPIKTPSMLPLLAISSPRAVAAPSPPPGHRGAAASLRESIGSARRARYGLAGFASDALRSPRPAANAAGQIEATALTRLDLYL